MTTPTLKCPSCLAHYVGKHRCDPLMRELVRAHAEGPIYTIDEITDDIASAVVGHLEMMYPEALKSVPKTARVSLLNFTKLTATTAILKLFTDKEKP